MGGSSLVEINGEKGFTYPTPKLGLIPNIWIFHCKSFTVQFYINKTFVPLLLPFFSLLSCSHHKQVGVIGVAQSIVLLYNHELRNM